MFEPFPFFLIQTKHNLKEYYVVSSGDDGSIKIWTHGNATELSTAKIWFHKDNAHGNDVLKVIGLSVSVSVDKKARKVIKIVMASGGKDGK